MVTWCDKLATRPSVGMSFQKSFIPSSNLLDLLNPFLNGFAGKHSDRFSLNKQEAFKIELSTDDGHLYGIDPGRISVEFQHKIKLKNVSGDIPVVEYTSKLQPFTIALEDCIDKIITIAGHVVDVNKRSLERVGIVSATILSEDEIPPGISKFIKHVNTPWKEGVNFYNITITSSIFKTDLWEDRCIHAISKSEFEEDGLISLKFDYQRKFLKPKTLKSAGEIRPILNSTKADFFKYLEKLAEGDMFDENISATD